MKKPEDGNISHGSPPTIKIFQPAANLTALLATVIDCHTKAVIGLAAGDNCKTPLIEQAIAMAARNYPLADDAVFHSDRGSNYTSRQFAETLKRHNIRQSVGRTGICYDNAMAESFFAALKNERVHRTQYPTREHARRDVVRQYCLVKPLGARLLTNPQRHAREFVDNSLIRSFASIFPGTWIASRYG